MLSYGISKDGLKYPIYIKQLLPKSKWYGKSTSLTISSLVENLELSKKWNYEYHSQTGSTTQLFIYLNHPLDSIKICGLVVGWKWKLIGQEDVAFWYLDDCSGTILCQCPKRALLAMNFAFPNVSGWTLALTGKLDQGRVEFKVTHIEVVKSLKREIQFWTGAFENEKQLQNPWEIDSGTLVDFYNRRPRTPTEMNGNGNYIEQLQDLHFQENELLLASPYIGEESSEMGVWNSDLLESTLEQDLFGHKRADFSDGQILAFTHLQTPKSSPKLFRKKLLEVLIEKSITLDTCSFYEPLNAVNRVPGTAETSSKILPHLELYNTFLVELKNFGLVSYDNTRLNLANMHQCYRYITVRLQSLINVQIPNITIKYDEVRTFCQLPHLSNKIILQICKHFLNTTHIGNLIDWWVEPTSQERYKVFFTYSKSR